MKKFILKFIVIIALLTSCSYAYEDSIVTARNYNTQGDLALKHALESKGLQKRLYLKEAKYFYQHSVQTYPDNFEGFIGLARSYMYLGRFDKAYTSMMIAYNFKENSPIVNYYMGEFSCLNEKYNAALRYYKQAIKYGYQNHYETNYQIGLCYDKLGDSKNAIKYYKIALKIKPDAKSPKTKIDEIANKDAKYKDYYNFY